jgi:decaprenyl-phosphate phosphoribosyltransferase
VSTRAGAGRPVAPASAAATPAAHHSPAATARGILRTARPKQWVKNVLVFAAPAAANALDDGSVLGHAALAFVVFCLAASSIYLLNDALDVEADRAHPTKRNRPIAAGIVPVPVAYGAFGVLAVGALVLSALTLNRNSLALVAVYLVLNVAYCLKLKHVVLVDVMIVASGFVLRAALGGLATDLPLTQWFLLTATFGSLFIAVGKRASDVVLVGADAAKTRKALEDYPPEYLRFLLVFSAAACAISYGLWAFSVLPRNDGFPWSFMSLIAFVFVLLRYALLVETGKGGEPENVVLRDRSSQVALLVFLLTFAGAVLQW